MWRRRGRGSFECRGMKWLVTRPQRGAERWLLLPARDPSGIGRRTRRTRANMSEVSSICPGATVRPDAIGLRRARWSPELDVL